MMSDFNHRTWELSKTDSMIKQQITLKKNTQTFNKDSLDTPSNVRGSEVPTTTSRPLTLTDFKEFNNEDTHQSTDHCDSSNLEEKMSFNQSQSNNVLNLSDLNTSDLNGSDMNPSTGNNTDEEEASSEVRQDEMTSSLEESDGVSSNPHKNDVHHQTHRHSYTVDRVTVEQVLPNFRDLATSSGLASHMTQGILFRSARHFASNPQTLKEVMCDQLNIRSVIDLRDDDLTPSKSELLSRTLLMRLYGLQMPIRMSRKTERAFRQLERMSDEMEHLERQLQTSRFGNRLQYVEGRTIRRTVLGPGKVNEPRTQDANELRYSALSLEDHSRFQEFLFHTSKSFDNSLRLPEPTGIRASISEAMFPQNNSSSRSHSSNCAIDSLTIALPSSEAPGSPCFSEGSNIPELAESAPISSSNCLDPHKMTETSVSSCVYKPSNLESCHNEENETYSSVVDLKQGTISDVDSVPSVSPEPVDLQLYSTHNASRQAFEERRKSSKSIYEWPARNSKPTPSFGSVLAFERQCRKLYIINVLNSPGVKERIKEEVVGSYALPLMLVAKITDKITGSSLAPYYFCKYFVSMHNILESYIEMIKYCGENFCQALKVITLAEVPILFHCTLGKDRTGIVAMLILSVLGASEEDIIHDYVLTEQAGEAFQTFNYDFIVRQSGLTEQFTTASEQTGRETLAFIRRSWGSVDGYLDWIGFDNLWRDRLRKKFLKQEN